MIEAKTIDDVAVMAKSFKDSIGFTLHPDFPASKFALAVIFYTNRSKTGLS